MFQLDNFDTHLQNRWNMFQLNNLYTKLKILHLHWKTFQLDNSDTHLQNRWNMFQLDTEDIYY
jgi:hypothetical protein